MSRPFFSSFRDRCFIAIAALLVAGIGQVHATDYLVSKPPQMAPPTPKAATGDVITTDKARKHVVLNNGVHVYLDHNTAIRLVDKDTLVVDRGESLVDVPRTAGRFTVRLPGGSVRTEDAKFAIRAADKSVAVVRGSVASEGPKGNFDIKAGEQGDVAQGKIQPMPRASHVLEWAKDLLADETSLVPTSEHGGGSLIAHTPGGEIAKITLRRFHIDVHIEDGFARTTIDQTYFNHESTPLEGTFSFPLPADASLSRLAMYVDGHLREAGMVERNHGRNVYESIRYARRDPALLEWVDGTTFKMRVFPMGPRTEKRLLLSYTQRLPVSYGQTQYRFPAGHSLRTVDNWSFAARVVGAAGIQWTSPSHTLSARASYGDLILKASEKNARPNRDVVFTLTDAETPAVRVSTAVHDGAQYLMLRYRPTLTSTPAPAKRHWAFLFESSGDRDPLVARAQIEMIRGLLTQMNPNDTFRVYAANTRTQAHGTGPQTPTADSIASALAFLEKAHLVGALDIAKAFDQIANPGDGEMMLVHTGSGIAALGERRPDELIKKLPPRTTYVGFAVGRRWDRAFMKRAAEKTAGHFTQVNPDEPLAWKAFELFAALHAPRLQGIRIVADDGTTEGDPAGKTPLLESPSFLSMSDAVLQGDELVGLTRVGPPYGSKHKAGPFALPSRLRITGTAAGKPFDETVPLTKFRAGADYLPRIWAKLEIDRLLAADAGKHREAIIALSKSTYVMSPFTSLLVLENDDMYTQYGVDRGRKDHWAMYAAPEKIEVVVEPEPGQPDPRKVGGKQLPLVVAKSVLSRTPHEKPEVRELFKARKSFGEAISINETQTGSLMFGAGINSDLGLVGSIIMNDRRSGIMRGTTVAGVASGMLPVGQLTPDLNVPIKSGSLDFSAPPMGGLPRFTGAQSFAGQTDRVRALALNSVPLQSPALMAEPSNGPAVFNNEAPADKAGESWGVNAFFRQDMGGKSPMVARIQKQQVVILSDGTEGILIDGLSALEGGRPRTSPADDARPFYDLVRSAPGMDSSWSDVLAAIEAEALYRVPKVGMVDDGVRELISQARTKDWRTWTAPGRSVSFNGEGRFIVERTLPSGLVERIECNGANLLHLYADLSIGAKRTVSRFHRLEHSASMPWIVPAIDDLTHGADLKLVQPRTIAVVPHGDKDAGQVHLVFGDAGQLIEKCWLGAKGKLLGRQVLEAGGDVRVLDGDGKELSLVKGVLRAAAAPEFTANLEKFVVLPLPYRPADHVMKQLKLEKKSLDEIRMVDALPLFASHFGAGQMNEAKNVFERCFAAREQKPIGFYALLAAMGHNLDSEHLDVVSEHLDHPLAQYLALHSSPVLRKQASQWAVQSGPWGDGVLGRLGLTHALLQRWSTDKINKLAPAQITAERTKALDFIKKHKTSGFAWELLYRLQDRTAQDTREANKETNKAVNRQLADAFLWFEDDAGLSYAARYESARCLLQAGQAKEARDRFLTLYEETRNTGLPDIDADFRAALEADLWSKTLMETAELAITKKRRPAAIALAWQVWQLEDPITANALFARALDGITDAKELTGMRSLGLQFLWHTGQVVAADELLEKMIADDGPSAELWRTAVKFADQRGLTGRSLECLEKALAAEYEKLPDAIAVTQVREEYGKLLAHYKNLAEAMTVLKTPPSPEFLAKVVRTADRWRALDSESEAPSTQAAAILRLIGDKQLAWDYQTTPLAGNPHDSTPWQQLAQTLLTSGDRALADTAFQAAFDAEPTNPQLLWDRAQNLRRLGRNPAAQTLVRQIAEGTWQPRFQGLVSQAKGQR